MPNAYSYFRAGGKTLEIIDDARRAGSDLNTERSTGLARFRDARHFTGHFNRAAGRYHVESFVFEFYHLTLKPDVPEGWTAGETQEHREHNKVDGEYKFYSFTAMPNPGTPDEKYVREKEDSLTALYKRALLEDRFGISPMPPQPCPDDANARLAFVRTHTAAGPDTKKGQCSAEMGFYHPDVSIPGPGYKPDNITVFRAVEKDGPAWYLRVPNDETGTPRFIPPDSAPVSFDEMMEVDARESQRRERFFKTIERIKHGNG